MKQFKNEGLDKYAETDKERAVYQALKDSGGCYETMAKMLGIEQSSVRNRLMRLRKKAALRGWAPNNDMEKETAEGFHVKGTSTLYDGEGNVKSQWVKTDRDKDRQLEDMRIAVEALCEPIRGKMKVVKRPKTGMAGKDLMVSLNIGDHHLGMYAWAEETGADWDLDKAEKILDKAFDRLIAAAPPAEKCLIVSIGDFYHADSSTGMTPRGGNVLDTDSRHSKVVQVGIRTMRRQIRLALTKYPEVEVLIISGNHDPESSIWLAHCLAAAFDDESRVTIRTDPRIFKYTVWGLNLIGTTHGHTAKMKDLPSIMACDVPEYWGATKFREFITGHIHHANVKEERGCTVRSIQVLSESDAWHTGQGYRSQRGMEVAVYHKRQGRVMTFHGTVAYIEDE